MNIFDLGTFQKQVLKIVDKKGDIRPLVPNYYQAILNKVIEEKKRKLEPIRIRILKCRQVGISTWGVSFAYHFTSTDFHKYAFVIANDTDTSSGLFKKSKMFWEYSNEIVRPMKRYSNEKELVFANPNESDVNNPGLGSSLRVGTAGKLTSGRSKTIQFLLKSEKAFWENASTVQSGLLQAVPHAASTVIIDESTANGMTGNGRQFYEDWMDTDYTKIFFKWTHNNEYEMESPAWFELDHYERELVKQHPELTKNKLFWRRYKIKNEMGSAILDPLEQFRQEYPLSEDEAFISSGRTVFNADKIKENILRVKDTKFKRGYFTADKSFKEDSNGEYKMFIDVKPDLNYVIGADVAEGLIEGDSSTMSVMSSDCEQVAVYCGKNHPDLHGKNMCIVGNYYKKALLAPEVNNHGFTTLNYITGHLYPNVYMRTVVDEAAPGKYTKKAGWQTNVKTKMQLIDEFVGAYRDDLVKIYCVDTLREMLNITIEPDGSIDLNGKDRFVALAISWQAIKQVRRDNIDAIEQKNGKQQFKSFKEQLEYEAYNQKEESYFD
jgi:hypothetical protein